MADTVRDVLIRFRVEGPRSTSGGTPALSGITGGRGASALSAPGGPEAGSATSPQLATVLSELTDAIRGLTWTLRVSSAANVASTAVRAAASAGTLAGLGGAAGGAMRGLGARALALGSSIGPLGIGLGVGAAALFALNQGGGEGGGGGGGILDRMPGAMLGRVLSDENIRSETPIGTGYITSYLNQVGRFRRQGQTIREIGTRFPDYAASFHRSISDSFGAAMGSPRAGDDVIASQIGFRNAARQRAFGEGTVEGGNAVFGMNLGMRARFAGLPTGVGGNAEFALGLGRARLGMLESEVSQAAAGVPDIEQARGGAAGDFERAVGQAVARLPDLFNKQVAAAEATARFKEQEVQHARQQLAEAGGMAANAALMGPMGLRRAAQLSGRIQAGETLTQADAFQIQFFSSLLHTDVREQAQSRFLSQLRGNTDFAKLFPGGTVPMFQEFGGAKTVEELTEWVSSNFQPFLEGLLSPMRERLDRIAEALENARGEQQNIQRLEEGDRGEAAGRFAKERK